MEPTDPLNTPLAILSRRIAAGEIRGDTAFNAMVTLVSADLIPPGATQQAAAQIRDEVILGLSTDRDLCRMIYGQAQPPGTAPPGAARQPPQPDAPTVPDGLAAKKPDDFDNLSGEQRRMTPAGASPPGRDHSTSASSSAPAMQTSASSSGSAAAPGPSRSGRRRRPKAAKERRPPPAREVDEDNFVASQNRKRMIAGVGIVALVGAVGGLYYASRPGPCDKLARQVCFELPSGHCVIARVRDSLRENGVDDALCEKTRVALAAAVDGVDNTKRPRVYGDALNESLGFDPRPGAEEPRAKKKSDDAKEATPAGPQPVVIVEGQASITSFFVDYAHIYWTTSQPPGIYRVRNIGGEAATALGAHPNPTAVTTTQDFVYWLSRAPGAGTLWVDKKRGDHPPFAIRVEGHDPTLAVFMGGEMAFVDGASGAVVLYVSSTETKRVLAEGGTPVPGAIAADTAKVYWSVDPPVGALMSVPREAEGAAPPSPSVLASGVGQPRALNLDGSHIYYIDAASASVMRLAKAGGKPEVLAKAQAGPTDLALDTSTLYWTNAQAGTVMRLPKAGGNASAIVTGQEKPRFVDVDKAAIYWEAGGKLYRLAK